MFVALLDTTLPSPTKRGRRKLRVSIVRRHSTEGYTEIKLKLTIAMQSRVGNKMYKGV